MTKRNPIVWAGHGQAPAAYQTGARPTGIIPRSGFWISITNSIAGKRTDPRPGLATPCLPQPGGTYGPATGLPVQWRRAA